MLPSRLSFFCVLFLHFLGLCTAAKFTLVNQCSYTVWPATLSGAGTTPLPASANGFSLTPRATTVIPVPAGWSGRVWAQTGCSTGPAGNFSCATGTTPPATLAEFTLNGSNNLDFYDVSLVDGYNLPLVVRPMGGSGNCSIAGCAEDLNEECPTQLRVVTSAVIAGTSEGEKVACKSACSAFGNPEYCCSGAYATPQTCKPSSYSEYFKTACPSAYSYAYDDASSTFTCAGADYVITFCPSVAITSKTSGASPPQKSVPPPDGSLLSSGSSLFPSATIIGMLVMVVWASLSLM